MRDLIEPAVSALPEPFRVPSNPTSTPAALSGRLRGPAPPTSRTSAPKAPRHRTKTDTHATTCRTTRALRSSGETRGLCSGSRSAANRNLNARFCNTQRPPRRGGRCRKGKQPVIPSYCNQKDKRSNPPELWRKIIWLRGPMSKAARVTRSSMRGQAGPAWTPHGGAARKARAQRKTGAAAPVFRAARASGSGGFLPLAERGKAVFPGPQGDGLLRIGVVRLHVGGPQLQGSRLHRAAVGEG